MTERQISAGGVIYRKTGSGNIEVALISVKGGKVWGLPKGTAEKGENLARTAHREVREETGLDGRIIEKIGHIEYFYSLKEGGGQPRRIFKIVYFFLMEYLSGNVADHDHEVDECRWVPIEEAIGLMRFKDEKEVLSKALRMILEGPSGTHAKL